MSKPYDTKILYLYLFIFIFLLLDPVFFKSTIFSKLKLLRTKIKNKAYQTTLTTYVYTSILLYPIVQKHLRCAVAPAWLPILYSYQ